ncbi:hypothetical protein [Pelistega sp. MC2]|uniref:hypothetical protein n=1 Tax=Pelistega sp. MC2 TaxID=1720297 RepID=UPI0008DB162E|nr:hypothetical protein [Pelistega sp. MC2]
MIESTLAFTPDSFTQGLSIYCVGGAVRDALLQLPPGDKDWVVVGATPEQMTARGFIAVGGDFPVFLHPKTKQEFALARTERKTAKGYQGFTFYTGTDVTLAEDLKRRDFTINAMASDTQGVIYDPYHGLDDLRLKIFRHVGDAFSEDPVRLLRLGRFLTRFTDFTVAPETMQLCRDMVTSGEVDALVAERVWKEISRALMQTKPSRCFDLLQEIGALERVLPFLCWTETLSQQLDHAALLGFDLSQRYALLGLAAADSEAMAKHLRVAREQGDYARYLQVALQQLNHISEISLVWEFPLSPVLAEAVVDFVEIMDGIRKSDRLLALIQVSLLVVGVPLGHEREQESMWFWEEIVQRLKSVPAGEIAKQQAGNVTLIKKMVREAREQVLQMP